MTEQIVWVTAVERAAARARVKIDRAHGRTTPEAVVKIANAQRVRQSVPDLEETREDDPA